MKVSRLKAACLIVIAMASACAHAVVAFNNFGENDTFKTGSGWGVDPQTWQACQFISSASGRLDKITIALSWVYDPSEVKVTLLADDGGKMGLDMRYWTVQPTAKFGTSYAPIELSNTYSINLESGKSYWIAISSNWAHDDVIWNLNNTSSGGGKATSDDAGLTWKYESRPLGAMRVDVQGVPEPATVIGIGFGALALLRRRNR